MTTTRTEVAEEAARHAVRDEGTEADVLMLAAAVAACLPAPGSELLGPVEATTESVTRAVEGWAGWIEAQGTPGSALRRLATAAAKKLRQKAEERVVAGALDFYTDPRRFPRIMANVLWAEMRENGAGIRDDRHQTLLSFNSADLGFDPRGEIVADGRPVGLLEPGQTGLMDTATELDALRTLGSAYVMPMAEYLVELIQIGHGPPGVTVIDKATVEFASWEVFIKGLLEGRSASDGSKTTLRDLARVLSYTRIHWPDGTESTAPWILNDDARRAGRPRATHPPTFTLDAGLRRNATAGTGQRIIPNVRPRIVPRMESVGDHVLAAQFRFVRHLWRHFVRYSYQLAEVSGVEVSPADLARAADEAKLPSHLARRFLEHLVQKAVIQRDALGRFAPAHAPTRNFMIAGTAHAARRKSDAARRGKGRRAK